MESQDAEEGEESGGKWKSVVGSQKLEIRRRKWDVRKSFEKSEVEM